MDFGPVRQCYGGYVILVKNVMVLFNSIKWNVSKMLV